MVPGTDNILFVCARHCFFVANLYMRWLICTYIFYSFFIMLELILSKNDSIIMKGKGDVNENDTKESKKPDLCRPWIDSVCTVVWRNRYDCTGGGVRWRF